MNRHPARGGRWPQTRAPQRRAGHRPRGHSDHDGGAEFELPAKEAAESVLRQLLSVAGLRAGGAEAGSAAAAEDVASGGGVAPVVGGGGQAAAGDQEEQGNENNVLIYHGAFLCGYSVISYVRSTSEDSLQVVVVSYQESSLV